ncbi:MAG: two-component system OmpR family response regulator [Verrucomicrobiales bacterium]|jgi:two-component system OmpR family response regulator
MRILVVEDQAKIADFVKKGLEENGFAVVLVRDGNTAYELACEEPFDAIVLDIMLPGRDGLSVLRGLREKGNAVPVMLLTARSELNERVEGFHVGADDYLTKPFYVEELVVRLQSLLRRSSGQGTSVMEAADLKVNMLTREVHRAGQEITLTQREFALLEYLMRSPGRVFTRTQIYTHVWGMHFDPGTNLVDVCIRRLRNKVDRDFDPPLIETLRGVGYRFKAM